MEPVMKKKIMIILTALFLIVCVFMSYYFFRVTKYKQQIKKIKIENIDFTKLKDGQYTGAFNADLIQAEVKVDVKAGQVKKIEIIKFVHGQGYGDYEISKKIIEKQSLQVDTKTGATGSGRVILESVQRALQKGL